MRYFAYVLMSAVLLAACSDKEENIVVPLPAMDYFDLQDQELSFGTARTVDFENDNNWDILFSSIAIGDPVLRRDRHQFFIGTDIHVSLQVSNEETPALSEGDVIGAVPLPEHHWYNGNGIGLAQRITPESGPQYWEGNWKDVSHKFIALQLIRGGKPYFGWAEISINSETGKMILHRAAMSRVPSTTVKAGK